MNEELKILITAVTADAKKKLDEVKKELEDVGKEGEKSGSAVDKALKGFGKGAVAAVAAIAAVTAALVSLGEKSLEFQKAYNRLTASFQTSGSTVKQAAQTYKDLFRFMGDIDTATEASNLLVQLTNDEKNLAEWTTILQGVYAKFPDSLPVEALAEASNETAKTGVVTGNLADALNWVGVSEDAFNEKLATTNSLTEREALIRQTLLGLYGDTAAAYEQTNKALMDHNESQANLDMAMASATQRTIPLMTALNNLSATMFNVFGPAIGTISTYLAAFIEVLTDAIGWVGAFFGLLGSDTDGMNSEMEALGNTSSGALTNVKTGLDNATKGANAATKALKEMKRQTMGFDELNVVSSNKDSASGGGGASIGGGSVSVPNVDVGTFSGFDIEKFKGDLEEAKGKIQAVLTLVGITGTALLGWKLASALPEGIASITKNMGKICGVATIVAGALLLLDGYTDAWVNGIDWENFTEILAGIGLIVGGIAMAFGPFAASIGLIAGGIAALVIGIKDLVENGYSMEAVIMVAVGAIAVLIGVVWALNAAMLANPLTWIVAAIMAVVAVIVILWNECDWFREAIIGAWEWIKKAFKAVVDWITNAFNNIVKFFKENWQALLLLLANPFAGAFKLIYDNCEGFRKIVDNVCTAIKNFFANLWKNIKNIFSSVGSWFKNTFNSAVTGIKNVFSGIGSFFSGIWEKIKSIFSSVGSAIGGAITNTVKTAINGVLSTAVKIINGFIKAINIAIKVINAIPGVNIKKLDTLDVPKLAKGGIVNSATLAMIGERGQEAVVPLENNTAWMDKLADRLTAKNGASKPVYLMVDKKVLGQVTAEGINGITALTGQIPLKLY